MEKIHISRATKEQIPETIEVIISGYNVNYRENTPESQPYFSGTYAEDIESGAIRVLVAKHADRIIGSVQYEDKGGFAYLSQMTVDPEFRRKGIGAELVHAAEESAKKEGFKKMQLTAMVEKGLPAYYEKLGYTKTGTKERPSYTLIIMEKSL